MGDLREVFTGAQLREGSLPRVLTPPGGLRFAFRPDGGLIGLQWSNDRQPEGLLEEHFAPIENVVRVWRITEKTP